MLELCNISKKYKDKLALNDVSFRLDNGIYGLLGPNGAGKSTLMNIITGNLRPTGGRVLWDGKEIGSLGSGYRAVLGFAPQQQGMYDTFSGRRFMSYMATLKGIDRIRQPEEIARVLRCVNMDREADHRIGTYSGGMKQRLLVAQAILGDPKLVVLDEPTAGLDPRERVRIRERISVLSEGRIIIVSTHVVSDIETIADEIILLKSGELAGMGSVEELCIRHEAASLEDVYMKLFGEEQDGSSHAI